MTNTPDPYCGPAPTVQNVLVSWNFDVVLMIILAVVTIAIHCANPYQKTKNWQTALLAVLLVIAFVSPLCAMTTALFSVRLTHHIIIGSVIAPLIAVALPQFRQITKVPAEAVFLAHTAIYWAWHLPSGYDFALSGTAQYWLMQSGLIVSSVALWGMLLSRSVPVITTISLALGTMVQMGLLGALLTFAREPLFKAHLATTAPFGLSPLQDQQLAGVLMWTVGFTPYVIVALWCIRTRLLDPHRALER